MRQPWFLLAAIMLGLVLAGNVDAQNPNYRVTASDGSGSVGDDVDIEFSMTIAENISGYGWSVCSNDNVSIGGNSDIVASATVDDADFLFESSQTVTGGWTVGAILDVGPPQQFIEVGSGILMYTVTYTCDAEGSGLVTFCDSIGEAPAFVAETAGGVEPAVFGGTIDIDGDAGFKFQLGLPADAQDPVPYESTLPEEGSFNAAVSILENSDNAGFPQDVQGFKFGVAHDPDVLTVTDADIAVDSELEELDPIYFGANIDPANGDGFTVGCVFSFENDAFIQFGTAKAVVEASYDVESSLLDGNQGGLQTTLEFDETLASPAVVNAVVVDSVETDDVAGYGYIVTLKDSLGTLFLRGDVNGDGVVGALLDAQAGLDWVFAGGDEPPCQDAMDINDDGVISALVDMLSLLWWGFGDGASPAAPGTVTCGVDTTLDTISCLVEGDGC